MIVARSRLSCAVMRLFTKQRHLHRFCQEPSRILRSALKKTSGRSAITTTDRLVCVKGGAVSVGTHATNWLFKLEGGAREFVLMVGEKRSNTFFFFFKRFKALLNSQAELQSRSDRVVSFSADGTQKSPCSGIR